MFAIVSLLSIGGVFDGSLVTSTNGFATTDYSYNDTEPPSGIDSYVFGSFDFIGYLGDLFSFFVWDIHFYDGDQVFIMNNFWLVRMFIVWLPLFYLILTIYYSVPTVSG